MEQIKLGTLCGCDTGDRGAHEHKDGPAGMAANLCTKDAVRMVTVLHVPPILHERLGIDSMRREDVPMCEACAAYHESKVAR